MIPAGGLKLAAVTPDAPVTVVPDKVTEFADAGDFERDHAFSFGAWVKLPSAGLVGSILARMDDRHNYRGWDLWLENGRIATHLVNEWPENAIKVVTKSSGEPGRMDAPLRHLRRLQPRFRRQDLHQRRAAIDRDARR